MKNLLYLAAAFLVGAVLCSACDAQCPNCQSYPLGYRAPGLHRAATFGNHYGYYPGLDQAARFRQQHPIVYPDFRRQWNPIYSVGPFGVTHYYRR